MTYKKTYDDFRYTKMPFGKYKGKFVGSLPDDYIKWAVMNFPNRGICEMMAIELQRRNPNMR